MYLKYSPPLLCYILVSAGYNITFNATEYEFDVNVYSPIATFVFAALLMVENINDLSLIIVEFSGAPIEYNSYSINGMSREITFNSPMENPLLTIRLDEALDPNDGQVDYEFTLNYFAVAIGSIPRHSSVNVSLHEIGKLDLQVNITNNNYLVDN